MGKPTNRQGGHGDRERIPQGTGLDHVRAGVIAGRTCRSADDAVARENEERIRKGRPILTEEEYNERLEYYLRGTPYKLTKMRYSSFTRYFGHLKRLKWVEETGEIEPSAIQDSYPPAPPRVYYRLTELGWSAPLADISNPLRVLYPHFDSAYYRTKRKQHHYIRH